MSKPNADGADTAVATSGPEPPTAGNGAKPEPTTTDDFVVDGISYTPEQTAAFVKKLQGKAQSLRERAQKAEQARDALKASQDEASNAALAEQGEFKELYEKMQGTHTSYQAKVNQRLVKSAVERGLIEKGFTAKQLVHLSISTEGLTIDPDTFMVQGDVAGVVNGVMEAFPTLLPATPGNGAPAPPPTPTQPVTVIGEHRSAEKPPDKPIGIHDVGRLIGDALVKTGMSDGSQALLNKPSTP